MATVAALKVRAATRFRDPNNNVVTPAQWESYLNDAYDWLNGSAGVSEWPHMQATANVTVLANTNSIALPTDAIRVLSAWDSTDMALLKPLHGNVTPKARFGAPTDTAGAPGFYRVLGNQLLVFPTPTAATTISLDYIGTPATLAETPAGGTVQTPPFASTYHQILVEYALYLAYVDDGNDKLAAEHMKLASDWLVKMQLALMSGQTDSSPQIVDSWYNQ